MCNGDLKEIKDVVIGDFVKTLDLKSNKTACNEVLDITEVIRGNLLRVEFNDLNIIKCTRNHPFYVKGKGWASFDPLGTKKVFGISVPKLLIGDICLMYDNGEIKEVEVKHLELYLERQRVFNLNTINKSSNYFVEKVLIYSGKK